jgi:hypothetical protein
MVIHANDAPIQTPTLTGITAHGEDPITKDVRMETKKSLRYFFLLHTLESLLVLMAQYAKFVNFCKKSSVFKPNFFGKWCPIS